LRCRCVNSATMILNSFQQMLYSMLCFCGKI
jgi:hypothetical protein